MNAIPSDHKNQEVNVMRTWVLAPVFSMMMLMVVAVSASPEMAYVQAGTFQMGNTRNDSEGMSNEKPIHTVTLTYDFWIGKCEVTFDEYDTFCEATNKTKPRDLGGVRGSNPVISVSWFDGIAYCNWLSEAKELPPAYDNRGNLLNQEGEITTDITQVIGFRLPTEAEWEYAAREGHLGSEDFKFAGSNEIQNVAWYWENSDPDGAGRKPQPVGGKIPNGLGLHDMSGNVSEWCHDRYATYTNEETINPIGPTTGSSRVTKGGSWTDNRIRNIRVAYRYGVSPSSAMDSLGFRLCRSEN